MAKRDDHIITSVYLTKEMCGQIDKMADRGHISRNEQIRRYIEKGLAVEGYSQDIDLIAGIIRQEVQAVYHIEDIKAVVEQQANRIAKMHMKSGKKDVARLVYQNSRRHVTMYRSVVSFGEETAKELLLTDKKAWERYIGNHIRTIAEKNGIRREHFQWAASLHREKSHPHIHVVFWDDSDERAKIKNPFTHPSVPNNIRRQMIKDTFADRIRAYGAEKTKAAADLRKISDSLVNDFESHIRLLGNKRYQRLREEYDLDAELAEDFDFSDNMLNETADRVFRLKSALPPRGRIAYQLLPEELKKQVDVLMAYLHSQMPELKRLRTDYVESKMKMVHLYGGNEEYLSSQRKKFEAEADKIIANRILGMVKTLNRLDDEGREAEYRERRKKHHAEQMLLEMLDMLSSMVGTSCRRYDEFEKAWQGELSKEARKELYLKYQDKGYEH